MKGKDIVWTQELKERKEKALFEVQMDLKFIEENRYEDLQASEVVLRKQYEEEKDAAKKDAIAQRIHTAQQIKAEYEHLKRMAEELPKYIKMLE